MERKQEVAEVEQTAAPKKQGNPVRVWTMIVLITSILLLTWYIVADRLTPFTKQARVHTLVGFS